MKEIVILADGDFPKHKIPISILKNAEYVICCDGAAANLLAHSSVPDAIAGDLDSIPEKIRQQYSSIIHSSPDQETNDLTKAVILAMEKHPQKITILGATGKREDHTLGNISLLSQYKEQYGISIEMFTDYGRFIPINRTSEFDVPVGSQVSIFSLDTNIRIKSHGLDYPLDNVRFDSWWKATLNRVNNTPFTLEFESGRVIVYTAY